MGNKNICIYSLIAMRAMPDERSEMVSQILFGEIFEVQETIDRWALIKLWNDSYQGWIDKKLLCPITEEDFSTYITLGCKTTQEALASVSTGSSNIIIGGGSQVYGQNAPFHFQVGSQQYSYLHPVNELQPTGSTIVKLAMGYLNAPYLWGGKTIFGIDCSGLTQVVYKMLDVQLPRDASQQALTGEPVSFIDEAKPGDLAFFDNAEGKITHVGLVMENKKVIHASGCVRIDSLDHQGIYNHETGKYTHKLRVVKRVV